VDPSRVPSLPWRADIYSLFCFPSQSQLVSSIDDSDRMLLFLEGFWARSGHYMDYCLASNLIGGGDPDGKLGSEPFSAFSCEA
jgi:hypothetical protein